jgi:HTH-like domain
MKPGALNVLPRKPNGQSLEDARLIEKIGEICAEYPRYGYRRVTPQLRRDGLSAPPSEQAGGRGPES